MGAAFEAKHPRNSDGTFAPKGPSLLAVLAGFLVLAALGGLGGVEALGSDSAASKSQWSRAGLTFTTTSTNDSDACGVHSYGDVQQYLQQHECTGLQRALYRVTDGAAGNRMVVATAAVTMPTAAQAADLKALVDRHGSGNVAELGFTEFTGIHYDSARKGATVIISQAEPEQSDGAVPAELLQQAATAGLDAPRG